MRDQSRLIRNADHTTRLIKRIVRSGVQLWYYKEKRQVAIGNWEELSIGVQGFVDSGQRLKASADAREGLTERARKGYNTGGVVYGYQNVPVMGKMASGQDKRLYTDFRINQKEANVVRRIFEMYRAGYGPRIIAKTANGDPRYREQSRRYFDGVRPPKPIVGKRGTGSWAPTAIRGMLRNERYAGVLVFGRSQNVYDEDGEKYRRKQSDPTQIVRVERPDLRIVPPELWAAVQARHAAERTSYLRSTRGELHGRPERGLASRYLFSGFLRCGCCGSSMVVSSQGYGTGRGRRQQRIYICSYRSHLGETACSNALRPRLDALDHEVLTAMEQKVLRPEIVRATVKSALEMIKASAAANTDRPAKLRRELAQAERERDNLVAAIATGRGRPEAIVAAIAEREQNIETLRREVAQLESPPLLDQLAEKRTERQLAERCAHWREVLAGDVPLARQALRALMASPILFYPEADGGYHLHGKTHYGPLLAEEDEVLAAGGKATRAKVASPRGFEPRLLP